MEVSPEDTTSIYQVLLQHVECFLLLHSYDFLVNFRVSRNPVFWKLLNLFNIDPSKEEEKKFSISILWPWEGKGKNPTYFISGINMEIVQAERCRV